MMIHPDRTAVFIEVCKNGSTACTKFLNSHGWAQNGSNGHKRLPNTQPGRHAFLSREAHVQLVMEGVYAFGVVRNPWDRMASLWRASAPKTQAFPDYLKRGRFKHGGIDVFHFQQLDWLAYTDAIVRYEQLVEEWNAASKACDDRIPVMPPKGAPVVNRSGRKGPEWTQETIDIVAKRFARDIEAFGYTGPTY